MYFDALHRLLPKTWDRGRTSTPCAFCLPGKQWRQMQISYRIYVSFYGLEMKIQPELRSIENLNPSSVVNDENVDLATRNVM